MFMKMAIVDLTRKTMFSNDRAKLLLPEVSSFHYDGEALDIESIPNNKRVRVRLIPGIEFSVTAIPLSNCGFSGFYELLSFPAWVRQLIDISDLEKKTFATMIREQIEEES